MTSEGMDPAAGEVGARVVLMTAPDRAVGESLARTLVEEGVATCATLIPGVVSIYRWQGELERQEEVQVILKTGAARVPALVARAAELHPYDVPELLVLPVVGGLPAYLGWVEGGG